MNEVFVLMRMGEDGSDGEMLAAFPTMDAAIRGRNFAASYEGEEMARLDIYPVEYKAE